MAPTLASPPCAPVGRHARRLLKRLAHRADRRAGRMLLDDAPAGLCGVVVVTDFTNAVAELRERLDREQRTREGREDPGERFGRNRVSGERAPAVKVADHVYRRKA